MMNSQEVASGYVVKRVTIVAWKLYTQLRLTFFTKAHQMSQVFSTPNQKVVGYWMYVRNLYVRNFHFIHLFSKMRMCVLCD